MRSSLLTAVAVHGVDNLPHEPGWACDGGTSASAPLVAALIARLNAARLAHGMGTMGLIHPWLYGPAAAGGGLWDVTVGDNDSCGDGELGPGPPCDPDNATAGFKAMPGWDPVTGLGTPNYRRLEEIALKRDNGHQSVAGGSGT